MHNNYTTKRLLSDILAGRTDEIREQWNETEAAADFVPLPGGTYEAHVQSVELFNAKTGTPGVKTQFRVAEGEHAGRHVFHDLWLTPAALPQTKRDCAKLGIQQLDQLENGTVPPGRIRCKVRVALRRDDDGTEYNRVRSFDVLSVDEPERDAFAPAEDDEPQAEATDTENADTSFNHGANAETTEDGTTPPEGGAE